MRLGDAKKYADLSRDGVHVKREGVPAKFYPWGGETVDTVAREAAASAASAAAEAESKAAEATATASSAIETAEAAVASAESAQETANGAVMKSSPDDAQFAGKGLKSEYLTSDDSSVWLVNAVDGHGRFVARNADQSFEFRAETGVTSTTMRVAAQPNDSNYARGSVDNSRAILEANYVDENNEAHKAYLHAQDDEASVGVETSSSSTMHDLEINGCCIKNVISETNLQSTSTISNTSMHDVDGVEVPKYHASVETYTSSDQSTIETTNRVVMRFYQDKNNGSVFARARETIVDFYSQKLILRRIQPDGSWDVREIDLWALAAQ